MASLYVSGVVLTPQEKILYEHVFRLADFKREGRVSAQMVQRMFGMANPPIPRQDLFKIWELSNLQKTVSALTKPDFYRSLRYIAIAQARREVSAKGLSASNSARVGLPVLNGINNQAILRNFNPKQPAASAPQPVPAAAQPHPAAVPPQVSVQPPSARAPAATAPAASRDPWSMSQSEYQGYIGFFKSADRDNDGFVSGEEANAFFRMSQLPAQELRAIWLLADVDGDNKLDRAEFVIAMHLVMRRRKNPAVRLPAVLPISLRKLKASAAGAAPGPGSAAPAGGSAGSGGQENGASAQDNDPLNSFISTPLDKADEKDTLKPYKIAQARDSEVVPLESGIKAQQNQQDSFNEVLRVNTEKLTQSIQAVADLKNKLETLKRETADIKNKIKDSEEELAHYSEQRSELKTQVEERAETVDTQREALQAVETRLAAARSAYEAKRQALVKQSTDINRANQIEKEKEAELERLKREGEVLDGQITRGQKILAMVQNRAKECEERKRAQITILNEKREQLGRIQASTSAAKSNITKSKEELERLKAESRKLRDEIRACTSGGGAGRGAEIAAQAEVDRERKTVTDLRNQLAAVKAGESGPAAASDPFAISVDTATPMASAPAAAPAASGSPAADPFTMPQFDIAMGGDADPFGGGDSDPFNNNNPFADDLDLDANAAGADGPPPLPATDDEGDAAPAEAKAETKAAPANEDNMFDDDILGGVTEASPAPTGAPAPAQTTTAPANAKQAAADPFDDDGAFDFAEAAAPAKTPTAQPNAPAAATASTDNDEFADGDVFDFESAEPAKPAAVATAAKTSSAQGEGADNAAAAEFDDAGFDFDAKEDESKDAAAPAPAPVAAAPSAGDDFGFDDENIFEETPEEAKKQQQAPTEAKRQPPPTTGPPAPAASAPKKEAPAAGATAAADSFAEEENPFGGDPLFDGADNAATGAADDEPNPFEAATGQDGGAAAPAAAAASGSKPAADAFDDFGEETFNFD